MKIYKRNKDHALRPLIFASCLALLVGLAIAFVGIFISDHVGSSNIIASFFNSEDVANDVSKDSQNESEDLSNSDENASDALDTTDISNNSDADNLNKEGYSIDSDDASVTKMAPFDPDDTWVFSQFETGEVFDTWTYRSTDDLDVCATYALKQLEDLKGQLIESGYIDYSGNCWGCAYEGNGSQSALVITMIPETLGSSVSESNPLVINIKKYDAKDS